MDIRQHLWMAIKKGEPVRIKDHFKGVPVSGEAEVLMLGQDLLALRVDKRFVPLIRHERRLYWEYNDSPETFKGRPIAFEHREAIVVLDKIEAVNAGVRRRLVEAHIPPDEEVAVILEGAPSHARGALMDFTPGADNALFFRLAFDPAVAIQRSQRISTNLARPEKLGIAGLAGTVVHVKHHAQAHQLRLQVQVLADPGLHRSLASYLDARRKEIETEWSRA